MPHPDIRTQPHQHGNQTTMSQPTKGCPNCNYPYYDIHIDKALVRMAGTEKRYVHSPEYSDDAICTCQGCDLQFQLGDLVDITEDNDAE